MSNNRGNANRRQSEQNLTAEDMQIALSFLKKRFLDYEVDQILFSLSQHVQTLPTTNNRNQGQDYDNNERNIQRRQEEITLPRTRITHFNRDARELRENIPSIGLSNEEKQFKYEEMRMIATFFCETGVNFSLVRRFFPQMTPQRYRAYLDTINNQAINEIQKFLRYECNIQIEHLSTDQKRMLKTQLMKVRQCFGQKHFFELQTYFKFISRHYEQKSVDISYDEALKLYKKLLQIVKSPFVDVMEIMNEQQEQNEFQPPKRTIDRESMLPVEGFTEFEERQVIQAYLNTKSILKTNKQLYEKHGISEKWAKDSITSLIRYSLKKTLKKVIMCRKKYLRNGLKIYFEDYNKTVKKLEENKNATIKYKLLQFYLSSRITGTGLTNLINSLNTLVKTREDIDRMSTVISLDLSSSDLPKLEPTMKQQQRNNPIRTQQVNQRSNPIDLEQLEPKRQVKQQERQEQARNELDQSDKMTDATNEERIEAKLQATLQNRTRQFMQVIEID